LKSEFGRDGAIFFGDAWSGDCILYTVYTLYTVRCVLQTLLCASGWKLPCSIIMRAHSSQDCMIIYNRHPYHGNVEIAAFQAMMSPSWTGPRLATFSPSNEASSVVFAKRQINSELYEALSLSVPHCDLKSHASVALHSGGRVALLILFVRCRHRLLASTGCSLTSPCESVGRGSYELVGRG
jgi:hypothetical protein